MVTPDSFVETKFECATKNEKNAKIRSKLFSVFFIYKSFRKREKIAPMGVCYTWKKNLWVRFIFGIFAIIFHCLMLLFMVIM